jgi:AcrR family transcriptional regulator
MSDGSGSGAEGGFDHRPTTYSNYKDKATITSWAPRYAGSVSTESDRTGSPKEPNAAHLPETAGTADQGLRERKKKLTRQLISDTATRMFLEAGFDAVRVVDVAAACGLAEKTVYNYFPTKEGLILDRFEGMESDIRRVFDPHDASASPVEAAVAAIVAEVETMFDEWGSADHPPDPALLRRFAEMIDQTPALRAAQWEMLDRMGRVAAEGMAARAGVDPGDPEPQIAASAILGLWRVQFGSMARHAIDDRTAIEWRDAVIADVRRAAHLIETGLWSFFSGEPPRPSGAEISR